jgi:hypothetical protein
VPLSEHEQRVLEQIERSLYAEDPKFAATVRGIDPHGRQRRRYLRAGLALLIGAALISVGLVVGPPELVAVGTVIAITAAGYAITAWQHGPRRSANRAKTGRGQVFARRRTDQPQTRHGIMQRFEDRWNRRREGLGN